MQVWGGDKRHVQPCSCCLALNVWLTWHDTNALLTSHDACVTCLTDMTCYQRLRHVLLKVRNIQFLQCKQHSNVGTLNYSVAYGLCISCYRQWPRKDDVQSIGNLYFPQHLVAWYVILSRHIQIFMLLANHKLCCYYFPVAYQTTDKSCAHGFQSNRWVHRCYWGSLGCPLSRIEQFIDFSRGSVKFGILGMSLSLLSINVKWLSLVLV